MKYVLVLYPVAICATVIVALCATKSIWCLLGLAFLPNVRWTDDSGEAE